ncbi:hypothetical protein DPEC_G00362130 [Dallia pectoralis]|nr:hypothetical protein DPEC_G00362130 [Dallia pectoralis]
MKRVERSYGGDSNELERVKKGKLRNRLLRQGFICWLGAATLRAVTSAEQRGEAERELLRSRAGGFGEQGQQCLPDADMRAMI